MAGVGAAAATERRELGQARAQLIMLGAEPGGTAVVQLSRLVQLGVALA